MIYQPLDSSTREIRLLIMEGNHPRLNYQLVTILLNHYSATDSVVLRDKNSSFNIPNETKATKEWVNILFYALSYVSINF